MNRQRRQNSQSGRVYQDADEAYGQYMRTMSGLEEYCFEENSEDLSYSDLDTFPEFILERADSLLSLHLDHNRIGILPRCIARFRNLVNLDISNNQMTYLSPEIVHLHQLRTLTAKNNHFDDDAIPKEICALQNLRVLNFSGNHFKEFPKHFTKLTELKCLYLGANSIQSIPEEVQELEKLEVLYLGGNKLKFIPDELGELTNLVSLVLSDNYIEYLPNTLSKLQLLRSLSLHNNKLSTLPPEIVTLNLVELSLRNNPMVVRFVQDMIYEPPSLLELAGRVIKIKNVPYQEEDVPRHLYRYLDSAQRCVNPKCKGVYFSSRVEHVIFVDFCGKYRLPLLEYLCSPSCSRSPVVWASSDSEPEPDDIEVPVVRKMKKVLLG